MSRVQRMATKKGTTKRPAPRRESRRKGGKSTCRVRMYRHGLGDCFLLSFPKQEGGQFHVLIDCGLISVASNPKEMMTRVANNIARESGGHLDLVVLTHEHWDHVSG